MSAPELVGPSEPAWPTVIVLASGRGERYLASGGESHKLAALLDGKPVLQHTLDAVRASGLPYHLEDAGHPGMGDAIAAAVRATPQATGWLILPGDLPLVQARTLRHIAQALRPSPPATPPQAVLPLYRGQRGHPVLFSLGCGAQLRALSGQQGAASVLRGCVVQALELDDVGCVTDIDTVQDLQQALQILQARATTSG